MDAANTANAAGGDPTNVGGNPRHNFDLEFFRVGNQDVEQTPSANLAVVAHEMDRLPQTLEVVKVRVLLRAAQVQVNDLRND